MLAKGIEYPDHQAVGDTLISLNYDGLDLPQLLPLRELLKGLLKGFQTILLFVQVDLIFFGNGNHQAGHNRRLGTRGLRQSEGYSRSKNKSTGYHKEDNQLKHY